MSYTFVVYLYNVHIVYTGRYSSVGIATRYGLDGPGIEFWWGARFSEPVQTGHSVQWVPSLFPGVKATGAWR
jgi:hypothetical protein